MTGMNQTDNRDPVTAVEPLEARILFTDLTSLGWAYRLPAGYGPASITYDVANLADEGVSGTLRLSLHLSNLPMTQFSNAAGTAIAEESILTGVEAGAHALRTASEFFDMDGLAPGTYYVNALLLEHTQRGAWERVAGGTLETITVERNVPFRGMSGTSHDGAISGFDAGDSQDTATPATRLPFTSALEEIAGNDVDYYEFTLAAESNVTATMADPGGTLALALLDESGAALATAARAAAADGEDAPDARITRTVPAGTYALRVTTGPDTDRAEYTVSVSATARPQSPGGGNPEPEPGSPLATARALGTPPNTRLNGDTTAEDLDDHFQFRLTRRSSVTMELSELSANLDLDLLYNDGAVAARSAETGTATDKITRVLEPGSYYLRAYGDAPATYSLRVSSTSAPAATPPPAPPTGGGNDDDDVIANARDLGSTPNTAMSGDVRDGHTADAYRFTLPVRCTVSAVLGDLSSPVEIALLKESGSPITRTRRSDASERTLTRTLAAGTYFVMVFRGGGSTASSGYTLALSTTPLESPGAGGPPAAPAGAPEVAFKGPKAARKAYRFTVHYTDPDGVSAATVGPDDILVTGPNGFSRTASIVKTKVKPNGTRISATYVIEPPAGTWFTSDNGEYQLNLQAATVADAGGNAVTGGTLGTFIVKSKKVAPAAAALFASSPITAVQAEDDEDGALTSSL